MKKLIITVCCFFILQPLYSQNGSSEIRYEDKIRISEAVNFFKQYGNKLWAGWDKTPFGILLVTNDNEYLINHQKPSEDFKLSGFDGIINTDIYTRPRKFPTNFLATFNAISNIPTVVVGQPENAGRSTLGWVKALLHEHFHQLQYSQSGYDEGVKQLDLAGGDSTGMWMLNYAFPYEDSKTAEQYSILMKAAKDAAFAESDFDIKYKIFMDEKAKFKDMLSEKDYRYFSFQMWQEGIAQYTEDMMVKIMIDSDYKFSDEFKSLKDYRNIDSFYVRVINNIKENAEKLDLRTSKRACFYTLGGLMGMILDRVNSQWRDLYFTNRYSVDSYF